MSAADKQIEESATKENYKNIVANGDGQCAGLSFSWLAEMHLDGGKNFENAYNNVTDWTEQSKLSEADEKSMEELIENANRLQQMQVWQFGQEKTQIWQFGQGKPHVGQYIKGEKQYNLSIHNTKEIIVNTDPYTTPPEIEKIKTIIKSIDKNKTKGLMILCVLGGIHAVGIYRAPIEDQDQYCRWYLYNPSDSYIDIKGTRMGNTYDDDGLETISIEIGALIASKTFQTKSVALNKITIE